ncbi:MAG TPA: Asp-tRNA(Asn)/Glu-tRNA(Gln) amidotransferase subunit GatA [Candidatus Paceibacterota bacterium]
MIETNGLTIVSAREHLDHGDFRAVELAEAYLKNIEAKNKTINAYLEVFDDVVEQAKEADKKIQAKKSGTLTGIPIAVKDNILIKGRRAGSASKILEGFVAPYDATVIEKLKKVGAVFLGRTNMDEFAMGGSNENSAYGPVKNPHDLSRVPGGSSGGSAAAVAMDGALAALGSDTGGSVRQPASFCGVVGLKPTYGGISRHGLMAMAASLNQVGTLAKTVEDTKLLFDVIRGKDPMDSVSIDLAYSNESKKITVGVPWHFMSEGVDPDVLTNFNESIKQLEKKGCTIREISIPHISYSLAIYYVLMPAEATSDLARFDGVKYGMRKEGNGLLGDYLETRTVGFGAEVRRRIMLGNYILSSGYYDAYYNKANLVRQLLRKDFEEVFRGVDVIMTPTSPVPAFKIGERASDPLSMYLADIFTVTANLVGGPAISIPSGFANRDGKNLPLGLQFTAPHGREDLLFQVSHLLSSTV